MQRANDKCTQISLESIIRDHIAGQLYPQNDNPGMPRKLVADVLIIETKCLKLKYA